MRISVGDACRVTGARALAGEDVVLEGEMTVDSRQAGPGRSFVAFRGERTDGNDYARAALDALAPCVVLSREPDAGLVEEARARGQAVLRAKDDDCVSFLLALAHEWRRRNPQWLVVGVTGSVGKTTTKDMLRAAFGSQRRTFATRGNLNSLIGLPLTLLAVPEGTEVVVAEMGMNHAGDIARMAACAEPALACVTNVGTSHIGNVGSREGIARAKAEIVSGMAPGAGVAPALALTSTNDYAALIARDYAGPRGVEVLWCGEREADDVRASDVTLADDGTASFRLSLPGGWEGRGHLGVPGRQAVLDLELAMALAWRAGLDPARALEAVGSMERTGMRLEVRRSASGVTVIDDSYNASPASMAAALDVLRRISVPGRRVAALGEMGEMGDEAPRMHALVGAYAAAADPDLLVLVGGALADECAQGALAVGYPADRVARAADVEQALGLLSGTLAPGDAVLVKASRAQGLDRLAKGVLAL